MVKYIMNDQSFIIWENLFGSINVAYNSKPLDLLFRFNMKEPNVHIETFFIYCINEKFIKMQNNKTVAYE